MDSIELKMSVPDNQRMALADIGVDPMGAQIRQVFFFDTPDLELFQKGVVLRARRNQRDDDDTVVKLRPVDPTKLPKNVRSSKNFKVEMDVTAAGYVISGSMKGVRKAGMVQQALAGKLSIEKLFTKEQRQFFDEFAIDCPDWSQLVALGPINVMKLKFVAPGVSENVTVEQWHYPGQIPAVELSTKSSPAQSHKLALEGQRFLREHGLNASGQQEPKTRKALEFLAARLASKQKQAGGLKAEAIPPASPAGKASPKSPAGPASAKARSSASGTARKAAPSARRTSSAARGTAARPARRSSSTAGRRAAPAATRGA